MSMPSLFDTGVFSVTDSGTGAVGAGWKLNFYTTGTSSRLDTYPTLADANAGTNANANPVVADAYGRLPAVWLLDQTYKAVLTDAAGVVKVTRDPINTTDLASAKIITDNFTYTSSIVHSTARFSFGLEGVLQSAWGSGFEDNTRFFVGNTIGRAGIVTFTRSSDNPNVGDMATYAHGAFTEHDSNKYAWGQYTEVRRRSGAGAAHGQEITMVNFGTTVDVDPYNISATNLTDVLRLSVGRGDTPTNTPASSYIDILKVGTTANKGIVVSSDALTLTGGQGDALNLATGHAIQWWTAAGTRGARIRSDGGANPMALVFADNVIAFQNSAFTNVVTITPSKMTTAMPLNLPAYTVATLPAGAVGDRAFVTDANATTFASVVAGGGANKVPVYYDGSWRIG